MVNIEAQSNSITIKAKMTIVNPKEFWDVGEEIIFDASSTDGFYNSLVFLFHDGSDPLTAPEPQVSHAFPIEGKFLVTLVALGTGGISSQATISVEIRNTQPTVSLPPLPAAEEDELITLTADVQDTPNDLATLQYHWVLGDGQTETGSEITHAWHYAGTYTITLQVADDQGAIDYDTTEITITNVLPSAEFEILTESVYPDTYIFYEDEVLEFDASDSFDSDSDYENLRYYWDFGDGQVGRGRGLHHAYHESGSYEVDLLVVDDDGARNSIKKTIEILNLDPTITLLDTDLTLYEGESYTFSAIAHDTETDYERLAYLWSFGETGWQASNTWTDDWSGEVSVQVEDPEGSAASDSLHVEVLNVPPVIQIDSAMVHANLTFSIQALTGLSFDLNFYEEENLMWSTSLAIEQSWSWHHSIPVPVDFDITKDYQVEIKYSDGIVPSGNAFAKLTYSFEDQNSYTLYHTFNCYSRDPWISNPSELYSKRPVSFKGSIFDPGMDDISGRIQLKTSIQLEIDFFLACLLDILGCFPFACEFDVTENTHVSVEGWMTSDDIIHRFFTLYSFHWNFSIFKFYLFLEKPTWHV